MTEISILKCSALIAEKNLKIAFAESATVGALSVAFGLTPYAGSIFLGSIVCYDADEKQALLKIPKDLIDSFTPESSPVTYEMALSTKKLFKKADIIVAVTGLTKAGGSETEEKPVGTIFLSFIFEDRSVQLREIFEGNSHQIVQQTLAKVAEVIMDYLSKK
ncbi:CinA family protein [Flavobacterium sp. CBA20B-1]|uniref:CinA family protein n=1 Tax=unclassified Flavobacterium TaxID=196869 RepID=UPI002225A5B2|nr:MULTISPECIES: CinA family protein [unclassified Flavobacterium]WCM41693.1 CinA family protein [Flavobacterium sp. CBA20B-1]